MDRLNQLLHLRAQVGRSADELNRTATQLDAEIERERNAIADQEARHRREEIRRRNRPTILSTAFAEQHPRVAIAAGGITATTLAATAAIAISHFNGPHAIHHRAGPRSPGPVAVAPPAPRPRRRSKRVRPDGRPVPPQDSTIIVPTSHSHPVTLPVLATPPVPARPPHVPPVSTPGLPGSSCVIDVRIVGLLCHRRLIRLGP